MISIQSITLTLTIQSTEGKATVGQELTAEGLANIKENEFINIVQLLAGTAYLRALSELTYPKEKS